MRVRLTDIRDDSVQELELPSSACDMPGWQDGVVGWSIGPKGSGAPIEIDEPLAECRVGVFRAGFQILLWGVAKKLPDIWLFPIGMSTSKLVPIERERWLLVEREDLGRVAMGGNVRLRIDQSPIRFGSYILECLKTAEHSEGCCAFCSQPLHMYFRVGSQQACPACTEKFKQETRADLDRYYRRALRHGIVVALAGSAIHSVLLSAAHVSFGSILIGILCRYRDENRFQRIRWNPISNDSGPAHVPCGVASIVARSARRYGFTDGCYISCHRPVCSLDRNGTKHSDRHSWARLNSGDGGINSPVPRIPPLRY